MNDKNDRVFLGWAVADSLVPFVLLPWTFEYIGINKALGAITGLFTLALVGMYAIKCGVGTAAQILITLVLNLTTFELQIFELEYACWFFEDIAWGNREVVSLVPTTKLDIPCNPASKKSTWAGVSSSAYKKTCGSTLLTTVPFFYRLVLVLVIWSDRVSVSTSFIMLMFSPMLANIISLSELFLAAKSTQERSYEAGSLLKLPGPILKHIDVEMCKEL